ncbi:MAG: hypothetical protein VKS61_00590 [Candidatus Sericytochromatia bacterium]|nr:hypothetical protein [Candidatus Sericytochromatia bacterium]
MRRPSPAAGEVTGQVLLPDGLDQPGLAPGEAPRAAPLDGLRVALLDAAGEPVRDEAEAPRVTATDASGQFRFRGPLPARHLVVAVTLPGGLGVMRALALRDARDRPLKLDLAATLTATHVLDRLLLDQPDRLGLFERLPSPVEGATREAARAALALAAPAPTLRLTPAATMAELDRLRRSSPALEALLAQLEQALPRPALREPADGVPALQAWLGGAPSHLLQGADQRLYMALDRVWRIDRAGALQAVLGGGTVPLAEAEGRPGREVHVAGLGGLCLDQDGRLAALAGGRLVRLEADDTLTTVEPRVPRSAELLGRVGGAWLLATTATSGVEVARLSSGGRLTRLAWVPAPSACHGIGVGLEAQRGVLVGFQRTGPGAELRLQLVDPATGAVSRWQPPPEARPPARVTQQGRLVTLLAGKARVWHPSGEASRAVGGVDALPTSVFLPDAEGPVLLGFHGVVQLGEARGLTRVAGALPAGAAPQPPPFAPEGLAAAPDGGTWLIDAETGALMRLEPSGGTRPVPPEGDARSWEGALARPRRLRTGPDGVVWLEATYLAPGEAPEATRVGLCRLAADGRGSLLHLAPAGVEVVDFAPGVGGRCHLVLSPRIGGASLVERTPDGSVRTLLAQAPGAPETPEAPPLATCNLAVSPEGTVWLLGEGRLTRFRPGEGAQVVLRGRRFTRPRFPLRGLELGPDGALYHTPGDATPRAGRVLRFDPKARTEAVVVGEGAGLDAGGPPPAPHSPAFSAAGELAYLDARSRRVQRVPREALVGTPYLPSAAEEGP